MFIARNLCQEELEQQQQQHTKDMDTVRATICVVFVCMAQKRDVECL